MTTRLSKRVRGLIPSPSVLGFLLIALVGLILPLTWFKGDALVYGGDFGFPMTDQTEAGRSYLYVWDDQPGTGYSIPRQLPYLTFQGLLLAAKFAGLSLQATEKLILALVLFGSGASMYLLAHAIFRGKGNKALIGLFAAGLYMFNQYSLGYIWYSIHGTALLYALAPAMLACYVLLMDSEHFKWRYVLAFNAVMLGASFSFAGPPTIVTAWVITLSYLPCYLLLQRQRFREAAGTVFRRTALLGSSWLLFNMWWLYPILPSLQESYVSASLFFTAGSRDPFKLFEITLNTLGQITSQANFINLLAKLSAHWQMMHPTVYTEYGDVKMTYSGAYSSLPFLLMAFLTPLFAFVSIFLAKGRNRVVAACFASLALITTFVLSGTYTPVGRMIWVWLLKNVPLVSSYRDPEEKFGTLLVLFMALLFGLGVGEVYERFKGKWRQLGAGTTALGLLVFVVYMYPFWTGEVVFPGGVTLPSALTAPAPDYYRDAREWLQAQGGDFRLFPLPGMEAGLIVLKWPGGGIVSTDLTHRWLGTRTLSDTGEILPRLVQKVFAGDLEGKAQPLLRLMSAKYALLHRDISWEYFPYLKAPEKYLESLVSQGLSLDRIFGGLEFYKATDPLPHIYAASDLTFAATDIEDITTLSLTPYLDGNPALAFAPQQKANDPAKDAAFLTTLMDRAGTLLFHDEKISDLALRLMEPRYRYPVSTWENKTTVATDHEDTYAVFGKPAAGKWYSQVTPIIEGSQPTSPNLAIELTPFYQSATEWKYFGNFALRAGTHEVALLKTWPNPLIEWRPVENFKSSNFDLYETVLPEQVPAQYTSQGDSPPVEIYRNGAPLKPSWNKWDELSPLPARELEFFELGNDGPRRLVVQVPKGSTTNVYRYTFAYKVERLAEELEELVVIPISTLAEVTNRTLTQLSAGNYRVANISTSGSTTTKDSFYVPKESDYLVKAKVSLNIQNTNAYWLPEKTDWSREISNWRFGIETGSPSGAKTVAQTSPPLFIFQQGFHPPEYTSFGSYRWAQDNATMTLINVENRQIKGTLSFDVDSIRDRDLEIMVNGNRISSVALNGIPRPAESWWDRLIHRLTGRQPGRTVGIRDMVSQRVAINDIWLQPGENIVAFYSPQGASVINDELHNGDNRVAAVRFSDDLMFRVTDLGSSQETGTVNNLSYRYVPSNGRMILNTYFQGDARKQEYLPITRDVPNINLEQYPFFQFTYKLEMPRVQAVDVFLGVDFTGDGLTDGYVLARPAQSETNYVSQGDTLSGLPFKIDMNVLDDARQQLAGMGYHPGQPLRLTKIVVLPHKIWGVDATDPQSARSGFYTYEFLNLSLYSKQAVIVPAQRAALNSPQGLANWKLAGTGLDYRTYIADDGALVLNENFRNQLVGVTGEQRPLGTKAYRLKDGTTLTGDVEWEDNQVVSLKNAQELGGKAVLLQKDSISLTFTPEWPRTKEFMEDAVALSTPLKDIDVDKNPYLGLAYRVENSDFQMVEFRLGVDLNGDGITDATFFPGPTVTLSNWQLVGSFESVDLYRTILPKAFPAYYNTEAGTLGKFAVSKKGTPLKATWNVWAPNEELAQVGLNKATGVSEVTINVPRGTVPTATYAVSYLPSATPSTLYEGYADIELNVRDALRQAFPDQPKARLSELTIRAKRVDSTDLTGGAVKTNYSFYLMSPIFYQKWAFPLEKEDQRQLSEMLAKQPLFRVGTATSDIDFKGFQGAFDKDGMWSSAQTLHLSQGLYKDGIEKIPNYTFNVDMVEVAEKAYQPSPTKAQVSFRQIDPTRYRVTVDTPASFWLVFNESFDPDWMAFIEPPAQETDPWEWSALASWARNSSTRTEVKDHYVVNTYANGWYLDGTGRYDVVIEYTPQRRFEIGIVITVAGLAVLLALVAFARIRRRLRRVPNRDR